MKHSIHDIELIERYFDNALSPEETIELKARLKTDYEFQKLFDQEKILVNAIRLNAAKKDLDFLKELERSFNDEKSSYLKRRWYYYAAAACITLVALFVWRPWDGAEKPQELYVAFFQPHPNTFEPTLRGTAEANLRAQAFQSYEQGNYARAAELFTSILQEEENASMLMLLGNSNLALGKTDVAMQNFIDLMADFDELDHQAKWYMSLCYLKIGDMNSAKDLLTEIARTTTPYSEKAKEVLERM